MTARIIPPDESAVADAGRILLAVDNAREVELTATFLEFEGFETLACNRGRQAVALALRERPDLMMVDFKLEDVHAFELHRAMSQLSPMFSFPRLLLVDSEHDVNPVDVFENGYADYLCRPFSNLELLSRIHDLIPAGRTRDNGFDRWAMDSDSATDRNFLRA